MVHTVCTGLVIYGRICQGITAHSSVSAIAGIQNDRKERSHYDR